MSVGDKSRWTTSDAIPYGSDEFFPVAPGATPLTPPSYPDVRPFEPHPWIPSGIDSAVFAGDELNGRGVNWDREVWGWTDSALSTPTMMGNDNLDSDLPDDTHQTVDVWVQREKRFLMLARDWNKTRAAGRRGTLDAEHPR